MTVIKGRKYILAGNFLPEYKTHIVSDLEKELKIKIVAVITSDYTHFIEYVDKVEKKRWF